MATVFKPMSLPVLNALVLGLTAKKSQSLPPAFVQSIWQAAGPSKGKPGAVNGNFNPITALAGKFKSDSVEGTVIRDFITSFFPFLTVTEEGVTGAEDWVKLALKVDYDALGFSSDDFRKAMAEEKKRRDAITATTPVDTRVQVANILASKRPQTDQALLDKIRATAEQHYAELDEAESDANEAMSALAA